MTSTRIVIKDELQFDRLEAVRERHGVNWRGMLIKGAERLESGPVLPPETDSGEPPGEATRQEDE